MLLPSKVVKNQRATRCPRWCLSSCIRTSNSLRQEDHGYPIILNPEHVDEEDMAEDTLEMKIAPSAIPNPHHGLQDWVTRQPRHAAERMQLQTAACKNPNGKACTSPEVDLAGQQPISGYSVE